ncbi:malate dehydrogenase [Methanoculleus bourgensis MS2]|uniref:malate dehydrogenase n=1 Tax=Methanoculleus bourgensis (strain ATCC 43281 / DSM 3045 / OCM 15 / MS2) TaxID=1201294 RepID=I7LLY8_METBM|nr:malate dehydrogenase [Methanoculleus bourgensis]CCJ35774.1 malate dehydrogenase [Methanoculleus bourgensis MS2]
MTSLAILGVGKVGGETAFLSAALGLADEIILYDAYDPILRAQVLDLQHTGIDVTVSTDTAAMRDADIFIFAAGTPRTPDVRTRADLLEANIPVVKRCGRHLQGFSGVVITITNPMDANNYGLWKVMGIDRRQCIGFGGQLDSARFACLLREAGVPGPAWVLGEHGEHQVPLFSKTGAYVEIDEREATLSRMRGASMEVIRGKGGTVFGPAYHIAMLIRAILEDRREVLSCSCVLDGEYGLSGCSLGVPARIGREGILGIEEWSLDTWEEEKMAEAGAFVKGLCRRFDD